MSAPHKQQQQLGGDLPPSHTLYCNNLNDKVKVEGEQTTTTTTRSTNQCAHDLWNTNDNTDLKTELYLLMTQYGPVLDVVAQKTPKKRGQAFVVFRDIAAATAAMRALQGKSFLSKPMRIQFAKTKSDAIAEIDGDVAERRRERVQKRLAAAKTQEQQEQHDEGSSKPAKRPREDGEAQDAKGSGDTESQQQAKRHKAESEQDDGAAPSKMLLVTGLPDEYTEAMLAALFSQIAGFVTAKLVPAVKGMAVVEYDNEVVASVAKERLRGFRADATHTMAISFMKDQ